MQPMTKPSDETLKQIDFVIQGLENGKYKELAKEVEFHQKLKGEADPSYFQSLIIALETAQIDITRLEQQTRQLETDLYQTKQDLNDEYTKTLTRDIDIKVLGKAIKYLMAPDPLGKNYDLSEINNWLSNKSIY